VKPALSTMEVPDAAAAGDRWFTSETAGGPTWAARPFLLLLVGLAAILTHPNPDAGAWLWVAALLVAGMPHGAYDLEAMRRLMGSRGRTAALFSAYALVMAGCIALFLAAPAWSLVGFLLLAAHHFGVSDSVWTRGAIVRSASDHFAGLGRGLCVIFAPFVFQPLPSWAPFGEIARAIGEASPPEADAIAAAAAVPLCIGLALVVVTPLWRRGERPQLREEWLTIAAYLAMASVTPPLLAIGAYFMLVHAAGHCGRARGVGDPLQQGGAVRRLANAVRVHRESVWLLVPSIAMVLVGAWFLGGLGTRAIALSFLLFCAVATLPHHLLWLGWRFGVAPPRGADAGRR
jgi:Brp/Blh family beta-carotene 15,15'-monooxygenase